MDRLVGLFIALWAGSLLYCAHDVVYPIDQTKIQNTRNYRILAEEWWMETFRMWIHRQHVLHRCLHCDGAHWK
jgi:hypothetical protein